MSFVGANKAYPPQRCESAVPLAGKFDGESAVPLAGKLNFE
jgi:hypothetical protein